MGQRELFAFDVQTEAVIDAPVQVVWDVLVDVANWSEWSTVLHHHEGALEVGQRPSFGLTPPAGRSYDFRPTITEKVVPTTLEWVGRTGVPGVFDGRHRFELSQRAPGGTHVVNQETFSGLLAPLMHRFLVRTDEVELGFATLNSELATRAETVAAEG